MNNKTICSIRLTKTLILLALLLAAPVPTALAQHQLWLRQFGTTAHDGATALATDGAGGVIVAGVTGGSLAGPGTSGSIFLARYDNAGDRLWIRQFGTNRIERAEALASDGQGGAFVAGFTGGSLGGPNAGFLTNDVFLTRYDEAGNQLWIRQFGTIGRDEAYALAPDGTGGVFVAGNTEGSLGGPFVGAILDVFLARYDEAGNQLWILQIGSRGNDWARGLASDGAGGVFVTGYSEGSLGGPSARGADVFLARYDDGGNLLWIRQFGTSSSDFAQALSPDGEGGVFVTGQTGGNLGGPIVGNSDIFLAHYDAVGNLLSMHQFGSARDESALAVVPDGEEGAIVAGWTTGSWGGPRAGQKDAFLAQINSAGELIWIHQLSEELMDYAFALARDSTESVIVAGETRGSLGGPNPRYITDAYVARYEIDSCYADCDRSTGAGVLDVFDFLWWQNDFVTGNSYACDCDTSTGPLVCDLSDFLCFLRAFIAGCP